jgi:hypothetical protein
MSLAEKENLKPAGLVISHSIPSFNNDSSNIRQSKTKQEK